MQSFRCNFAFVVHVTKWFSYLFFQTICLRNQRGVVYVDVQILQCVRIGYCVCSAIYARVRSRHMTRLQGRNIIPCKNESIHRSADLIIIFFMLCSGISITVHKNIYKKLIIQSVILSYLTLQNARLANKIEHYFLAPK